MDEEEENSGGVFILSTAIPGRRRATQADYPTPDEVEAALTAHYLRSDGPSGAGPLRYIDASRPELRRALGCGQEVDPLRLLGSACGGAYTMASLLAYGWDGSSEERRTPGFFRFLVLTCGTVAAADANRESREFGANLSAAFGTAHAFANRAALPGLWIRLRSWCLRQRARGLSIRELVLPQDSGGSHYRFLHGTYALAFPTWRDLSHLRVVLDRHPEFTSGIDPVDVVRTICPVIRHDEGFSSAMRLASEEFRQLYQARASLLRLHRFWTAFSRVADERIVQQDALLRIPRLDLRCSFELEDAVLSLSVVTLRGDDPIESDLQVEGPADEVMQVIPAWLGQHKFSGKGPAAALLVSGALPLLEAGLGLWTASHKIPEVPRRCLLLLSNERKDFAHLWNQKAVVGQNWTLVGPFAPGEATSLYARLGLRANASVPSVADSLRMVGGFRTGDGLLGRKSALPQLLTAGSSALTIRSYVQASPPASLLSRSDGLTQIEAAGPLDGRYVVRLEEEPVPGVDPLAIERRLLFYRDAVEHSSLTPPEANRWIVQIELASNQSSAPQTQESRAHFEGNDCAGETATTFDDLLEAIYAEGSNGWSEQELVSATRDILGPEAPSPWDVLRGLYESGWLLPAVSTKWRARRWWLRPAGLVLGSSSGGRFALLKGSAPVAIRRRFVSTAQSLGAQVSLRCGVGPYSPLLLMAHGSAVDSLPSELGWQLEPVPQLPADAAPQCWPADASDPARHIAVATWSWKRGTFLALDDGSDNGVALRRFRRTAGDRPDLYTVEEGSRRHWAGVSRTIAIAEAHRRASVPLFANDGGRIVRLASDGYLPLPLAALSTIRTARYSGPVQIDERWTYAYAMDAHTRLDVRRLLGPTFIAGANDFWARDSGLRSAVVGHMRGRSDFRPSSTSALPYGNRY